jgi:hypothetical protein
MELSNEAKEARNRYHKEWREKNKERYRKLNRQAQRRYWERQALKQREDK